MAAHGTNVSRNMNVATLTDTARILGYDGDLMAIWCGLNGDMMRMYWLGTQWVYRALQPVYCTTVRSTHFIHDCRRCFWQQFPHVFDLRCDVNFSLVRRVCKVIFTLIFIFAWSTICREHSFPSNDMNSSLGHWGLVHQVRFIFAVWAASKFLPGAVALDGGA